MLLLKGPIQIRLLWLLWLCLKVIVTYGGNQWRDLNTVFLQYELHLVPFAKYIRGEGGEPYVLKRPKKAEFART